MCVYGVLNNIDIFLDQLCIHFKNIPLNNGKKKGKVIVKVTTVVRRNQNSGTRVTFFRLHIWCWSDRSTFSFGQGQIHRVETSTFFLSPFLTVLYFFLLSLWCLYSPYLWLLLYLPRRVRSSFLKLRALFCLSMYFILKLIAESVTRVGERNETKFNFKYIRP